MEAELDVGRGTGRRSARELAVCILTGDEEGWVTTAVGVVLSSKGAVGHPDLGR